MWPSSCWGVQTAEQIGALAARCLSEFLQLPSCFYLTAETQSPLICGQADDFSPKLEAAAVQTVFSANRSAGRGCDLCGGCTYRYFPVSSGQRVLAAAGIRLHGELEEENQEFLQLLLSQFAMALERRGFPTKGIKWQWKNKKNRCAATCCAPFPTICEPP